MKRILAIILVSVMTVSVLCLTSCAGDSSATEIETINGMTASQALSHSLNKLDLMNGYQISVDAGANAKVLFINIPFEFEDMYIYTYNSYRIGEASHQELTKTGEAFLANETISELLGPITENLKKETWYVDGMYYCVELDGTRTKELTPTMPKSETFFDKAMDIVLEEHIDDAKCYENADGEVYVEILLEGASMNMNIFEKETYRVYFDEDSSIEKMVVLGSISSFTIELVFDYDYDIEKIEAPEDTYSFTLIEK